jgi:RNA polymerase sigma-70 factor (ECF subfamily)
LIFRAVEDADLIRKARRGDVEAYNLLISRWERRVYNYLLRIVANREDALDLSQDVFLKAYQNLRKLYRIAHNEAYSLFRKRRPEGETEELQPETMEGAATVGGNAVFPVELTLAVSSALHRLTADQRETVILKIYQGFKFEEIAEIVAAPVSTVKSRLYTALDLLKAELAPAKATVKARGVT